MMRLWAWVSEPAVASGCIAGVVLRRGRVRGRLLLLLPRLQPCGHMYCLVHGTAQPICECGRAMERTATPSEQTPTPGRMDQFMCPGCGRGMLFG
jgi:hypothetical protein